MRYMKTQTNYFNKKGGLHLRWYVVTLNYKVGEMNDLFRIDWFENFEDIQERVSNRVGKR